jgi:hypothetical protein
MTLNRALPALLNRYRTQLATLSQQHLELRQECATQAVLIEEFMAFDALGPETYTRAHLSGHFTASCWLLDPEQGAVLLTLHRKLGRWLQLGGHADGELDLTVVALQEAEEESGIADIRIEPEIFDLDRHLIPARSTTEPQHYHWDVRFVLHAAQREFVASSESLALAWVGIDDIADPKQAERYDVSLQRMARRWLATKR